MLTRGALIFSTCLITCSLGHMTTVMGFVRLLLLFQASLLAAGVRGTSVLWYRTAQNTPERLAPQTPLNFTADFAFVSEVQVDR